MGLLRTVLAIQIRNTLDVELAARGCGESAADRCLAGDEIAGDRGARVDCCCGSEAQKSCEGGQCELHYERRDLVNLL